MPQERRNNRIAVYFTKSELSLLESEKGRLNEDSASKVIVRICKNYFDNLENESNSKPQPMNKEDLANILNDKQDQRSPGGIFNLIFGYNKKTPFILISKLELSGGLQLQDHDNFFFCIGLT